MTITNSRPRKPAAHLIHLIQSTKNHHPNFVLFLGAGASAESGVKTAGQMIRDWRDTYASLYSNDSKRSLESQPWYDTPSEYSHLFEALYDQPTQRREFIENCLDSANPSWGYIYLVDLIRQGVFNAVFTTNFDDLLNEACYLYSTDVRPIVCAHDSSIRSVRITTKRPKIIKLHGDFLFDSIKNTVRELESLENNMRDKLKQYATEFGMIVVGYSGHDRSIMDTLDAILRNDDSLPHGVYWCVRKDSEIGAEVDHLCRFPRFHIIEIEGFDSFFSEAYNVLTDVPHPIFSNPYGVAAEKLGSLLGSLRAPAGKIEFQKCLARDVSLLGRNIQQVPSAVAVEMPHQVLAWNDFVQGEHLAAIGHIRKDIGRGITRGGVELALRILKANWNKDLADDLVAALEENRFKKSYHIGNVNDIAIELLNQGRFDYAEKVLNAMSGTFLLLDGVPKEYFLINRAQVHRHRKEPLPAACRAEIEKVLENSTDTLSQFGALVVLDEFDLAKELLIENCDGLTVEHVPINDILGWPISKLLPQTAIDEIRACFFPNESDTHVDVEKGTISESNGEPFAVPE